MSKLNLRKFQFLLIALLAGVSSAFAQGYNTTNWKFSNPKQFGFTLQDVDYFDNNTAIAVGSDGGIAKSTDGGRNWTYGVFTYINQAGFKVKATFNDVHFITASVAYAVGNGGVMVKTTDGGVTWNVVTTPLWANTKNINTLWFLDANKGYIAGQWNNTIDSLPKLYFTLNGGSTWDSIAAPPSNSVSRGGYVNNLNVPSALVPVDSRLKEIYRIEFLNNNLAYICGSGSPVSVRVSVTSSASPACTPNPAGNLTTTAQAAPLLWKFENGIMTDYSVSKEKIGYYGISTNTVTCTTTYGSVTPSQQTYKAMNIINDSTVVLMSFNNNIVLKIHTGINDSTLNVNAPGVYEKGKYELLNWAGTPTQGPNAGPSIPPVQVLLASNPLTIRRAASGKLLAGSTNSTFAGTPGYLWTSIDTGRTWKQEVPYPQTPNIIAAAPGAQVVDIAPNGRVLVMGTNGAVTDSIPGGSWQTTYITVPVSAGYADMEFVDCNNGIAVGGASITVTTDGGNTWIDRFSAVFQALNASINAVSYVSPTKAYFATSIGNIYRTANQAVTNSPVFAEPTARVFDMATIGTDSIWACGDLINSPLPSTLRSGVVYRSFNNAATWDTVRVGPIGSATFITFRGIEFPTRSIGYIVGNRNSIYKTIDGGATWTNISPIPVLSATMSFSDIQALNKDTVFVIGQAFPIKVVYRTTDGGATWVDITSNITSLGVGNLNGILMHDINNGYVMTPGGALLVTNNGGASWTLDLAPTANLFTTAAFVPKTVGPGVNMINRKLFVSGPNITGAPMMEYGNPANTQVNSTETITDITCTAPNSGVIVINASGGLAPYTYSLNGGPYQVSNTFSGLAAGTYTISIKDAYCGLLTKTVTIGLTNNLNLTTNITNTTICQGASVQLIATSQATTFVWTPSTGLNNPNIFNPIATPASTTVYTVTASLNGCTKTADVTINVNANPILTIVADPGTVLCQGDPTRLTVESAPTIYTFTSAGGLTIPSSGTASPYPLPLTVSGLPAGAIVQSVTLTGLNHTWTGDIDVAITGPTFVAGGSTQAAMLLSDLGNDANDDAVNTTITFVDGSPRVPNQNPIPSGTYSCTNDGAVNDIMPNPGPNLNVANPLLTALNGATMNGTWNLWVNDQVGGDQGNLGSYTVTFAVPGGPLPGGTYAWSPATGLSSTNTNPVAASPAVTTTYTVIRTTPAGCSGQASITITVNTRPSVTTQPSNTTVCSGSTATFTAAGAGTGFTYQWQESTNGGVTWNNLANGAPYSGVTTGTLTINPVTVAMNGYRYRLAVSGTCPPVANSNGAILTVNALPVVTINPAGPVCGGVAGTNGTALTASGASTYTWAPTTGLYTNATATTAYAGGNANPVYAAPTVFTTYTVSGTAAGTGCVGTASVIVNYTPPPPTVTPNPVVMCLGDPAVKLKSSSSTSSTVQFCSGPISIPIPDNNPAGVTSNITASGIPAACNVSAMAVTWNLTHTWNGDMVIALKAPNGQILNLDYYLSSTGGAGATTGFVNTKVSSTGVAALSSGTGTYTGTFKADAIITGAGGSGGPTGYTPTTTSWAPLYGTPNGTYTLAMYDGGAVDVGTLTSWCLDITYTCGVPSTPAVWSPIGGLFSDANATVPYVANTPVDSVWTRPTPAGVYNYNVTVQSLPTPPAAVTTPMAGGNGNNMIFFNLTNTNGYAMTLTGVSTNSFGSGAVTANIWMKTSPIAGNPGLINPGNGWNIIGSGNSTVTANTLNPVVSGMNVVIPAGVTYGIGVEFTAASATFPAYTNGDGTIDNYTNNGVTISVDGNIGWGGPVAPGPPANNPRNFNGAVYLTAGNVPPCTSPARVVTVTVNTQATVTVQPVNQTICTDKVATFSVAATIPLGAIAYQWEVSTNSGNTYTAVTNGGVYSGATTPTLTITAPPVSMSGYFYRCRLQGPAPCTPAYSFFRILTVNPLPTVVISASPYVKLFPGLITTISSTVTPFAAAQYVWRRDGVIVGGANTGTLSVDVDKLGEYQLTVTDVNGCVNSSNKLNISDSVNSTCFLYPNPSSGRFQVRYYSVANNVLPRTLTIYDAKGTRVFTQNFTIVAPYARMDVDMRAYSKGIYWVEIGDRNGSRLAMCRAIVE